MLCVKICYILGVTKTHRRNEQMRELIPEEYGLVGRELAAAAVVKFYVGEVEGTRAERKSMICSSSKER